MISSIHGTVLRKGADFLVIDVGGVGFRVEVPSGKRAPALTSDTVFLHTSLIVRQDAMTLFGFPTLEEIEAFEHMLTVSGVGPRSALGILSALTPNEIAQAVTNENDKAFRQAPGIGPKTAKLLIVSLAGKLDHLFEQSTADTGTDGAVADTAQVILGLTGLGWSQTQAEQAVADALRAGADSEAASLMRSALKLLQAG